MTEQQGDEILQYLDAMNHLMADTQMSLLKLYFFFLVLAGFLVGWIIGRRG